MGLQGFLLFVPDVTKGFRHIPHEQAAERERELD
jgi:hypothetical protein